MQYLNQAQACYSDYDVVELAPISDSLIIEVQTEELPQDFFEGFLKKLNKSQLSLKISLKVFLKN